MKNIILTGMPGSGKSTLGVLLAKTLGAEFVDTDLIIQSKTGRLLHKIVEEDGKEAFLDIERDAILTLEREGNTVIATGGSAVLRKESMDHLKKNGVVVYLYLPYISVSRRIRNIRTRGIAFGKGETLLDLYKYRKPYYENTADIIINCDLATAEKNLKRILKVLSDKGIIDKKYYVK